MFKSLLLYKINPAFVFNYEDMEEAIKKQMFEECSPTKEKSSGWIPPRREEHGAMIESINGHWMLTLCTESKILPASVLNRKVAERIAKIEKERGYKPGKKEKMEIKDEVKIDLLPMSHTTLKAVSVWIDPTNFILAIDTSTQAVADAIVTMLVEGWPGFSVSLLHTQVSPQALMTDWLLSQEPIEGFTLGRECELKSAGEDKAVVRYGRHPLDIAEITEHIKQGKHPVKLAITYDDRVSFVLTEGMRFTKIQMLEEVFVDAGGSESKDDRFDADVTIMTAELKAVIEAIVRAHGGEFQADEALDALPDRTAVTVGKAYSEPDASKPKERAEGVEGEEKIGASETGVPPWM